MKVVITEATLTYQNGILDHHAFGSKWYKELTLTPPCTSNHQISGSYEKLRAQYPLPQLYSGLALFQMGPWGQSHTFATQEDKI